MNIYEILMSKDKCETFFPKLSMVKEEISRKQKSSKKRTSKNIPNIMNRSIDETKCRRTYQEILRKPTPQIKDRKKSPPPTEKTLRTTFVKQERKVNVKTPDTIQGYHRLKQLGKGGFAEVMQVQNEEGEKLAMKKYQLEQSFNCFRNEQIVGSHFYENGILRNKFNSCVGAKHIIRYVDKFKRGKSGYIVQEVGGKSLSKMISDIQGVFHKGERVYEVQFTDFYQRLKIKDNLISLLSQLAEAIRLLNSEGFIHCDLKPENILVKEDPLTCKIIDFGSSFVLEKGLPKITITPEYMPPELLLALDSDRSSEFRLTKIDVWSLGCIALEIVTGVPLWFRYKCKLQIRGRECLQLGFFALTNREYHKIVKRQKQICQSIPKMSFVCGQFQFLRPILKRIFVCNEDERADINEIISLLKSKLS